MPRSVVAALAFAVLLARVPAAEASIAPPPPPHRLYAESEIVFTGRAVEVGDDTVRVQVDEVLKGRPGAVVEVGPVHPPTCTPGRDPGPPVFAKGDRLLVAATRESGGWRFHDPTLWSVKIEPASSSPYAASVPLAREMLRIAALPDATSQRAAMVRHLRSEDPRFVDAVRWFQFAELDTPEKSAPHTEALVDAALGAPTEDGRVIALRALVGLTPAGAFDRLVAATRDDRRDVADSAVAVVARYDRPDAVDAVRAAATGAPHRLIHLAESPRPEAAADLRSLVLGPRGALRALGLRASARRFARLGATPRDVDDVLGVAGGDLTLDETDAATDALLALRSPRAADAMLRIVREPRSREAALRMAYRTLWEYARNGREVAGVPDLLRREEAVFIRRLDADGQQLHLCWILGTIHTDAAREALERAERKDPEGTHGDAWRTLYDWDER